MKSLFLLLLISSNYLLLAQNEVTSKKHIINYGFNVSLFISKEFDKESDLVLSPSDFNNVNFTSKSAIEFELYTRFNFSKKLYIRPSLSFVNNHYTKNSRVFWQGGSAYSGSGELRMNATLEERLMNIKFILPFGKEFRMKKWTVFLEGAIGINKVLNYSDLVSYYILENTLDPVYGTTNSFINKLKFFAPQNKFPLLFRFNTGFNFKIYRSITLNFATFAELYYYKKGSSGRRVFPLFNGFSIGLMRIKR